MRLARRVVHECEQKRSGEQCALERSRRSAWSSELGCMLAATGRKTGHEKVEVRAALNINREDARRAAPSLLPTATVKR